MIATICAIIYLIGVFFSIFILIPYLIANRTIMSWESEDAVSKAIIWPLYLAYLFVIAILVLCVAVIYMPFDFLFEKSVKYFTDRKKRSDDSAQQR